MKTILSQEEVDIPEGVTVDIKSRFVEVKGPKGVLKRNFRHISFDTQKVVDPKTKRTTKLKLQMWFAKKKQKTSVTTVSSLIKNMIKGVTQSFKFRMRFAYAHFPINPIITNAGKTLEIKNFLGEKLVRKIDLLEGVKVAKQEEIKDEITLEGNDLQNVSLSCALIHQSVKVRHKDIRKFLDGIYVSDKNLAQ